MRTRPDPASRPAGGFTLAEVMIAMSGAVLLMAIFLSVYQDTSKIAFLSGERNQINRDIRTITGEMSTHARAANYFVVYRSFSSGDRNEPEDRLLEGNSGDFLVLVFQGDPGNVQLLQSRPTTRIVGYYRAPSGSGNGASAGPVRKFDLTIDEDDHYEPLEELLPSASSVDKFSTVIELSEGLADGRLFYNLWGRSVMVNGKIIHGNAAKRVTDTYNFTISPRGQQG